MGIPRGARLRVLYPSLPPPYVPASQAGHYGAKFFHGNAATLTGASGPSWVEAEPKILGLPPRGMAFKGARVRHNWVPVKLAYKGGRWPPPPREGLTRRMSPLSTSERPPLCRGGTARHQTALPLPPNPLPIPLPCNGVTGWNPPHHARPNQNDYWENSSCSKPWPLELSGLTADQRTNLLKGGDFYPGSAEAKSTAFNPYSHSCYLKGRGMFQKALRRSDGGPSCGARPCGPRQSEVPRNMDLGRQSNETGRSSGYSRGTAPGALGHQSEETGAGDSAREPSSFKDRVPPRRVAASSKQFSPTSMSTCGVLCLVQRRSEGRVSLGPRITWDAPDPVMLPNGEEHTRRTFQLEEFHARDVKLCYLGGTPLASSGEDHQRGSPIQQDIRAQFLFQQFSPCGAMACTRSQERKHPPRTRESKGSYPFPCLAIPAEPPEMERLFAACSPFRQNKSAGHNPHPQRCRSVSKYPWNVVLPYSRDVAVSKQDRQRGKSLSMEITSMPRSPQFPGYTHIEVTPGKSRDPNGPSGCRSTQGDAPLVISRSYGAKAPTVMKVFVPPPPKVIKRQQVGGG